MEELYRKLSNNHVKLEITPVAETTNLIFRFEKMGFTRVVITDYGDIEYDRLVTAVDKLIEFVLMNQEGLIADILRSNRDEYILLYDTKNETNS